MALRGCAFESFGDFCRRVRCDAAGSTRTRRIRIRGIGGWSTRLRAGGRGHRGPSAAVSRRSIDPRGRRSVGSRRRRARDRVVGAAGSRDTRTTRSARDRVSLDVGRRASRAPPSRVRHVGERGRRRGDGDRRGRVGGRTRTGCCGGDRSGHPRHDGRPGGRGKNSRRRHRCSTCCRRTRRQLATTSRRLPSIVGVAMSRGHFHRGGVGFELEPRCGRSGTMADRTRRRQVSVSTCGS